MTSGNQHWEKIDFHSPVLADVLRMLPPWLIQQSVDEKGAKSHGLPVEVYRCGSNQGRKYFAAVWHILNDTQHERFAGYIEILPKNEVICSSIPPVCASNLPDFLSSCECLPVWRKLRSGEIEFHRAEIEIVRSMLPVWLIQHSVSSKASAKEKWHDKDEHTLGEPTDILVYSTLNSEYYAYIWCARKEDGHLERFVGYIEISPQNGLIVRTSASFGKALGEAIFGEAPVEALGTELEAGNIPEFLSSRTPVPLKDYFWTPRQSDEKKEEQSTPSVPKYEQKYQESSQGITDLRERVEGAIKEIQENFDPEPQESATEQAKERWRRRIQTETVQIDEVNTLRSFIEQKVSNFTFSDENVSVHTAPLDFYEGYSLYRIIDRRGLRSRTTHFVAKRDFGPDTPVCALGNTSAPIHEFNAKLSSRELNLTGVTAADYLVFFCRFVHADAGAFQIIEDPEEDLDWISSELEKLEKEGEGKRNVEKDVVKEELLPIQRLEPEPGDKISTKSSFHYSAFVGYGRDLYFARFEVRSNGWIYMEDDELCFYNLPIVPLTFDEETEFILRIKQEHATPMLK